jgi:selenocysteine lyase/cysteine desulfurase
LLAEQVGATVRVIPINDRGELILEEYGKLLGPRTKFVSVAHVSNSLGTINPVESIIALAHARGVPVLVDGAQSTPHLPVNVTALDADFFVFSGHKIFGPTGIGALYGKAALLEAMPPWQGGGHMIKDVRFEKTLYQHAPEKFEAGTPDIAGVVGLGAAIDYLFKVGIAAIAAYEHALLEYATPGAGDRSRSAPHRHGGHQGQRAVVHHPRCAERKYRAIPRQTGYRRSRRASLRATGTTSFRPGKHRAPFAGVLQYARGGGCPGACASLVASKLID